MDLKGLVAGTRPTIEGGMGKILMSGADGFDGYEITEYKGMVWGISVRAKDFAQDFFMGCKQFTGGELSSYSELGDESRQKAINNMLRMAARQNANGVINVTFEISGNAHGAAEVVCHGTAVQIEPIIDYVPAGAIGNVLAEIQRNFEENRVVVKRKDS